MRGRWFLALMLPTMLSAALFLAWREKQCLEQTRAEHTMLQKRIHALRARQSALEIIAAQSLDLCSLIARAESVGLDPARWMLTALELDTAEDLTRLKNSDTLLRSLKTQKKELYRQSGARPVAAATLKAEAERLDTAIARRQAELEEESRVTPATLGALLRTLSSKMAKDSTTGKGLSGYWFVPESLSVTRLEQYPGCFAVQARGEFLLPR